MPGSNVIIELDKKSKRQAKPTRRFPPPPPDKTPPPPPTAGNFAVEAPPYKPPPSSVVSWFPYPNFYQAQLPEASNASEQPLSIP